MRTAAVRAAGSNVFFSVKRDSTVSAVACFDFYLRLINEHFLTSLKKNPKQTLGIYDAIN
jgi:hypothetical protein